MSMKKRFFINYRIRLEGCSLLILLVSLVSCQPYRPIPIFETSVDTSKTPTPYTESSVRSKMIVQGSIQSMAISPDFKLIALGTLRGVVLYDLAKQLYLQRLGGPELIISVAWSPDGKKLAASSVIDPATFRERPHLVVWDTSMWRVIYEHYSVNPPSNSIIGAIAWSPDSRSLAVNADYDGVYVFNTETNQLLSHQTDFRGTASSISWSPDGLGIVSIGDADYGIRRWNVATDEFVRMFDPRLGSPIQVAWSPDGRRIASGYYSGALCFWTVSTNTCDGFIQTGQMAVSGLAWSPDGNRLATGGGVIRIWDTKTGELLTSFGETPGSVYPQIVWPSGGRQLIELDENLGLSYVRVWDITSGALLFKYLGSTDFR
jgi:WD40 repeat protein